jgi:hypothetical protein
VKRYYVIIEYLAKNEQSTSGLNTLTSPYSSTHTIGGNNGDHSDEASVARFVFFCHQPCCHLLPFVHFINE